MPTLPKQLAGPIYQTGAQIYSGLLPIPETELPKVQTAFETFKAACENAVMGTVRVPSAEEPDTGTGSRARGAPAMNEVIVGHLSAEPLAWCTPNQILRGIKAARPNLKIEALQTRLKRDAGKPGMWIVGPGNKYGMPGAAATKGANSSTTTVAANVVPAPAAVPGQKRQARVLAYIIAHPGYTKTQIISAFAASPTPVKAQYIGVDLGRLRVGKTITDSKVGPYWPLPAARPTVATAVIGDGAVAPA